MRKTIVLSLGGSLIVPDKIDIAFLKDFRKLLLKLTKTKFRFIICCGGGKVARNYQEATKKIYPKAKDVDLDWVGTMASRLNGELVRAVLSDKAKTEVMYFPNVPVKADRNIIIAAGWIPGWSTDYDSILLAETFNASLIVNMTNIDVVYDKDPKKYKNARQIKEMNWASYRKISGSKWSPGLSLPFDPIAAKTAQKKDMKVVIMNGKKLKNFENFLLGKKFIGTIIR